MVSVFQFVVTHPVAIEFDFPSIAPLLPSLYGSIVFGCRVSFLVGSSIFFVFGCSAVSCNFTVSVRRAYAHILLLHLLELISKPTFVTSETQFIIESQNQFFPVNICSLVMAVLKRNVIWVLMHTKG